MIPTTAATVGAHGWGARIVLIAVASAVGVVALRLADFIPEAGRHIVQGNPHHSYLAAIVWSAVLGISVLFWPLPERARAALLAIWAVKVGVALGFMLVYEHAYATLDSYVFYRQSLRDTFRWSDFDFGRGSVNLVTLLRLHHLFIPPSFHAVKITESYVGLIAIVLFFRAAVLYTGVQSLRPLFLIACFPGVLFWSSILGKEPLVLLGIALYVYGIVRWHTRGGWSAVGLAALGVLIAAGIRVWLAPILIIPLIPLSILGQPGWIRIGRGAVIIGALALAIGVFQERFAIATAEDLIAQTDEMSQRWARGGSAQAISGGFDSVGDLIRFLPLGMFSALFRPLPGELLSPFGFLASMENAVLLWLLVLAVRRTRIDDLRDPLVLWSLSLIVVWSAVYGFVSYQNLGTAVRFKLQILPVLLLVLMHLSRRRSGPAVRGTT